MKFVDSMGYRIFTDDLSKIELSNDCKILNTISPNSYTIATKDDDFKRSLRDSDFLVLDGVYFALASLLLKGKNIKKNQGPDVYKFFINKMDKESGRVFFLGSSQETLNKIIKRLNKEFPNITAGFFSPPFKDEFSVEEDVKMLESINSFKPDILFVGMTCPKQEKWSYKNIKHINAKLVCSIGAVFDWYAGNQKEIHPIWWKLRLGWVKRAIDRPAIFKRWPYDALFLWYLLLVFLKIRPETK